MESKKSVANLTPTHHSNELSSNGPQRRDSLKSNGLKVLHWDDLDKKRYYFWGFSLFLGVRALVYPSNLVKTVLQVQHNDTVYRGTLHAFREIIRQEGFRALYKGFWVNTLGLVSGNVYVSSYEILRSNFLKMDYDRISANMMGGSLASLISQTIVVPLDVVSQRLMLQKRSNALKPQRAIDIVRDCVRQDGIRGLYRGYFVSLVTYAPSSAIWWTTYDNVVEHVYNNVPLPHGTAREAISQALTGGLSGITSAVLTNPLDVIRTRTQVENTPARTILRSLVKEEGLSALYRGVTARMLSMGPSGVLIISTYELVKRLSKKRPDEWHQ